MQRSESSRPPGGFWKKIRNLTNNRPESIYTEGNRTTPSPPTVTTQYSPQSIKNKQIWTFRQPLNKEDPFLREMEENAHTAIRLNKVPRALLQLNQPPPIGLWVGHLIRYPRDANCVGNLLHLVLHAGPQLARLQVAENMYLLRPTRHNKHWHLSGVQDTCREDIHIPDI